MSRDFDGIDDMLAFTPASNIVSQTQGTIVAWLRMDNLLGANGTQSIVVYGGDNVAFPGIFHVGVRRRDASFTGHRLDITQATEGVSTTSGWYCSTTLSTDIWYPVAFRSNGSTWSVFLNYTAETLAAWVDDGAVGNNGDWFGDTSLTNAVLRIGRGKYDGTDAGTFNGKLAYVQNFNVLLTIDEIRQASLYPGSIRRGLTWFVPCWGGSPEPDYSGNGNHGTVTGATVSSDNPPINGLYYPRVFGNEYAMTTPAGGGGWPYTNTGCHVLLDRWRRVA